MINLLLQHEFLSVDRIYREGLGTKVGLGNTLLLVLSRVQKMMDAAAEIKAIIYLIESKGNPKRMKAKIEGLRFIERFLDRPFIYKARVY